MSQIAAIYYYCDQVGHYIFLVRPSISISNNYFSWGKDSSGTRVRQIMPNVTGVRVCDKSSLI